MPRYSFYIDGLNVYYALQNHKKYHKYKWLNYRALAENVVRSRDTIESVYNFTAVARWRKAGAVRHEDYIRALRSVGVSTILGRFMKKDKHCHRCNHSFKTHEEKRTDVNIGLYLLSDAIDDRFDKAVLVSADSDLLPVIAAVEHHSPDKEIGVMLPIDQAGFDLRQTAHFVLRMNEKLLAASQFPDEVTTGSSVIKRPDYWR